MKTLLLLRGIPASGKSTWIRENNLQEYTLSIDTIRIMCQNPGLNVDGTYSIMYNSEELAWKIFMELLENRMANGDFTVVDNTNATTAEMNRCYDLCKTYNYKAYCVDFTDVSLEECIRRNRKRRPIKITDEILRKFADKMEKNKVPSTFTVIKPHQLNTIWEKPMDLNKYKKIHVIGDIHGCNTVLQKYISVQDNKLPSDECYIFCGDYIDRGKENAEVLKFLLSIYNNDNVILLEGNHERSLKFWSHDQNSNSREFETVTKLQLEKDESIDKKSISSLYRSLKDCAYFKYGNKVYLVTHAGISRLPDKINVISSVQFIRGVGKYGESDACDESFDNNTPDNYYQIHGHRNIKESPIHASKRCYNLECGVETGGELRAVQLIRTINNKVDVKEIAIPNYLMNIESAVSIDSSLTGDNVRYIDQLRANPYIKEKFFGDVSSFNFTREAFNGNVWDYMTIRARGLFMNTKSGDIIARSYNKFFEMPSFKSDEFNSLENKLKFPLSLYVKENGYLGIVGYKKDIDQLFVTTKSDPTGDHSKWLRDMIESKLTKRTLHMIKDICKSENVSFVFECINMDKDPHIISYEKNGLVLLDIIYNEIEFKKMDYDSLSDIAEKLELTVKTKLVTIPNWNFFIDFMKTFINDEDRTVKRLTNRARIEGFVLEDSDGFMLKYKTHYYKLWKFLRGVTYDVLRYGISKNKMSSLETKKDLNLSTDDIDTIKLYYDFITSYINKCRDKFVNVSNRSICEFRNLYYTHRS